MKVTKNYANYYLKINKTNTDNKSTTDKKSIAEYTYIVKDKFGQKKEKKFISRYASTIDIPYAKYTLK